MAEPPKVVFDPDTLEEFNDLDYCAKSWEKNAYLSSIIKKNGFRIEHVAPTKEFTMETYFEPYLINFLQVEDVGDSALDHEDFEMDSGLFRSEVKPRALFTPAKSGKAKSEARSLPKSEDFEDKGSFKKVIEELKQEGGVFSDSGFRVSEKSLKGSILGKRVEREFKTPEVSQFNSAIEPSSAMRLAAATNPAEGS